jgi:hypothetical protein
MDGLHATPWELCGFGGTTTSQDMSFEVLDAKRILHDNGLATFVVPNMFRIKEACVLVEVADFLLKGNTCTGMRISSDLASQELFISTTFPGCRLGFSQAGRRSNRPKIGRPSNLAGLILSIIVWLVTEHSLVGVCCSIGITSSIISPPNYLLRATIVEQNYRI